MIPDLVYDVGLNNGDDTAFYLSQGYRVIAIEANPALVAAASERFHREVALGCLCLLNVGIAEQEGEADFWLSDERLNFSSFSRGMASRDGLPHHSIRIPTVRFATILERHGTPYYLKIDIEGNETLCLTALASFPLPAVISVESECPTGGSAPSADDGLHVLRALRDLGYSKFKLIDQRTFCSLSLPAALGHLVDDACRRVLLNPPLNRVRGTYWLAQRLMIRSALEHKFNRPFPPGSSGPFGDDTPGRWMKYEQAERSYRHYREMHYRHPAAPAYSFWCDWHAKL